MKKAMHKWLIGSLAVASTACLAFGLAACNTDDGTPLDAPVISLNGNAINWEAVDNAEGYDIYEDGNKVGSTTSVTSYTVQNYAGTSHSYHVVATTTNKEYKSSKASNSETYTVKAGKLGIGEENAVDVATGNYEDIYTRIELDDAVELNQYYFVYVSVNNNESATGEITSVTVYGNGSANEADENNWGVESYVDGQAGVFVGVSESVIVLYVSYAGTGAPLGLTVSLSESCGEYIPSGDGDDVLVPDTYMGITVTLPAGGEKVEIKLDENSVELYETYKISVAPTDVPSGDITLTLYNSSLSLEPVTLTYTDYEFFADWSGEFQATEYSIYLASDAEVDLEVNVFLYTTGGDEYEDWELAVGHDVTTYTTSVGTASVAYAGSVDQFGTTKYVVVVSLADSFDHMEDFSKYQVLVANEEGEEAPVALYDAFGFGSFSGEFTPNGANLIITINVWDDEAEEGGAYVPYTESIEITVSLENYEDGGSDDERQELYSGLTSDSIIFNSETKNISFKITVYEDGDYIFTLNGVCDGVEVGALADGLFGGYTSILGEEEGTGETRTATVHLEAGTYTLSLSYYGSGSCNFTVLWQSTLAAQNA